MFVISPPLWFKAVLAIFLNFLQDKLKQRIEVVPKEMLLQRLPVSSIPERLGGTLKVDHLAWLNICLASFSERESESANCNGNNDSERGEGFAGNISRKGASSMHGENGGLSNEGSLSAMEFLERMMTLKNEGIENEFIELRKHAGSENFLSGK